MDMVRRVGPLGWPGCPAGVVCTRFGVRMLAVGADGAAHYIANVVTSSDFQFVGRMSFAAPGIARFEQSRQFSCAHPADRADAHETRWLRFRADAQQLWLGVDSFDVGNPFSLQAPAAEPTRWVVFRRVPRDAFYGRWLLRRCQPIAGADCDDACFSDALVD